MNRRVTGLTPRQSACLHALKTHHGSTGTMPSVAELGKALGIPSKGAVHRLLVQLETRGAIKRWRGRARAIRLTLNDCPNCGAELP